MKKNNKIFRYLLISTGMVFVAVMINISAIKIGYYIEKENNEIKNLISQNKYLTKQINTHLSAKSIEENALKMGLRYPEPYSIIILNENKKSENKDEIFSWLVKTFQKKPENRS